MKIGRSQIWVAFFPDVSVKAVYRFSQDELKVTNSNNFISHIQNGLLEAMCSAKNKSGISLFNLEDEQYACWQYAHNRDSSELYLPSKIAQGPGSVCQEEIHKATLWLPEFNFCWQLGS